MAGVYMILCTKSNRYYIGSTGMTFDARFARWRSWLKRGKAAARLQREYDTYGVESFVYIPLREMPLDMAHAREQEAIRALQPALNSYRYKPEQVRRPTRGRPPNHYRKPIGPRQQKVRTRWPSWHYEIVDGQRRRVYD